MEPLTATRDVVYDFEVGDELADVRLLVEEKVLFVHKAILANASPVWKKMFTLPFRENTENEVRLPGKRSDDIIELLKIIYPSHLKELDENKLPMLLELCEEYDMAKMRNRIESHLVSVVRGKKERKRLLGSDIDSELAATVTQLQLAERYRLEKLRREGIEYVARTFDKKTLERNGVLGKDAPLDAQTSFDIVSKMVDDVSDLLKLKQARCKELEDENVMLRFKVAAASQEDGNSDKNSLMTRPNMTRNGRVYSTRISFMGDR